MPDEADTDHRWGAARWIGLSLVLLLALLVLYVLSPGPAPAIALRVLPSDGRVMAYLDLFYRPLTYLLAQSETAVRVHNWYLGLWGIMWVTP